jgi:hypothetical protein
MGILVRHYLHEEPDRDLDGLLEQYAAALFLEDRQITVMASAIGRAFSKS